MKIHTNLILTISRLSVDLIQHVILIYNSSFSSVFMPTQLYITHSFIRNAQNIYSELDKYKKFRNFLRNLNNDYPLVHFGVQNPQRENERSEYEECAICKEQMLQARKLPCNHCFHQFCIMQLIENGSKLCPICRAEFNAPNRLQAPPQGLNNNGGGQPGRRVGGGISNLFSLNLGGWLPNISVRMIRARGPVIPVQ